VFTGAEKQQATPLFFQRGMGKMSIGGRLKGMEVLIPALNQKILIHDFVKQ